MSLMVLRTQGPEALFDDHRLILHTSSYDAERARVFHVCGECLPSTQPGASSVFLLCADVHLSSGSEDTLGVRAVGGVCVCVHTWTQACVRVCVCVRVHVHMHVCTEDGAPRIVSGVIL